MRFVEKKSALVDRGGYLPDKQGHRNRIQSLYPSLTEEVSFEQKQSEVLEVLQSPYIKVVDKTKRAPY